MAISSPKSESVELFNAIAPRYDFINSILSLGLHNGWRRQLLARLPQRHPIQVLDLATGTADVPLELVKSPRVQKVVGIDMSKKMVRIGRQKVAEKNLAHRVKLRVGDAQKIPFKDCRFDAVTMAFGIRNVADVSRCLFECYRVLKPEGRLLILEFSMPPSPTMRIAHLCYLRYMLPRIGQLLSGNELAYQYLNESIQDFPHGNGFIEHIEKAGFDEAGYKALSCGVVNLYWGDKH